MSFLIPNLKMELNKMKQKLKVVFTNEIDAQILDKDFYFSLLKVIRNLKSQTEEKTQNGTHACACLDTSESKQT